MTNDIERFPKPAIGNPPVGGLCSRKSSTMGVFAFGKWVRRSEHRSRQHCRAQRKFPIRLQALTGESLPWHGVCTSWKALVRYAIRLRPQKKQESLAVGGGD